MKLLTDFIQKLIVATLISMPSLTLAAEAKIDTIWSYENDYVRLEPTESGKTNAHPAVVDAKRLTGILASIQVKGEDDDYQPLLKKDESERFAGLFKKALAKATPAQDIVFFTTERRGDDLLPTRSAVSGRVFVTDDKINVIIGTSGFKYLALLATHKRMPPYSTGSRITAGEINLRADNANYAGPNNRHDWLAWGLNADLPVQTVAPRAVEPQTGTNNGTTARPAPSESDDQQLLQRLRRLQRLHGQGLITEEEYQAKRKEILNDL